jgi:hypothetical protein
VTAENQPTNLITSEGIVRSHTLVGSLNSEEGENQTASLMSGQVDDVTEWFGFRA